MYFTIKQSTAKVGLLVQEEKSLMRLAMGRMTDRKWGWGAGGSGPEDVVGW